MGASFRRYALLRESTRPQRSTQGRQQLLKLVNFEKVSIQLLRSNPVLKFERNFARAAWHKSLRRKTQHLLQIQEFCKNCEGWEWVKQSHEFNNTFSLFYKKWFPIQWLAKLWHECTPLESFSAHMPPVTPRLPSHVTATPQNMRRETFQQMIVHKTEESKE